MSNRIKTHTKYRLADGTLIPGVTTITGLRAKPALIAWANKLGLKGIESSKYVDEKAVIGTCAHYIIQCHLNKETADMSEYAPDIVDLAQNSVIKYFNWEKGKKIELIHSEMPLVSEKYKFGGCIDLLAKVDDELCLVDFKTGKYIFAEQFYQLAAYSLLLKENGHNINKARLLRIGRDENEGFEERIKTNMDIEQRIFLDLLDVYYQEKLLGDE